MRAIASQPYRLILGQNRYRMKFLSSLCCGIVVLISFFAWPGIAGEGLVFAQASRPIATLEGWEEDTQTMLQDRFHGIGSLYFDRGLYRRFTKDMDDEYDIDLRTMGFTPTDHATWFRSPFGFRLYFGSINFSRLVTFSQFRTNVPLRGKHHALLQGIAQEDLRAKRFLIKVGYQYHLPNQHKLGFTLNVQHYKPDVDLLLHYSYGNRTDGLVHFELGWLDLAHNLIFDKLGVDPVHEDTTRSYSSIPLMFSTRLSSPTRYRVRGELVAGVQTKARATIASQEFPDRIFQWKDLAHYAGVLVEYQAASWASLGIMHQYRFGAIERRAPGGSFYTSDYRSQQSERLFSLYALGYGRQLRAETWFTWERYHDVQKGSDYDQALLKQDMDFLRQEFYILARLHRVPTDAGMRAGADLRYTRRTQNEDLDIFLEYMRFEHLRRAERSSIFLGYQFSKETYFLIGASVDIDGDRKGKFFDGAFSRLTVLW